MITRRSVPAVAALCVGGLAAVAIPAGIAVGQSSPPSHAVIVEPKAVLKDRGVVAVTKLYVACPAGEFDFVSINLTERDKNAVAEGGGYEQFNCTGQIETLTIEAVAGNHPFGKGKAFAQVFDGDSGAQVNKTITLVAPSTKAPKYRAAPLSPAYRAAPLSPAYRAAPLAPAYRVAPLAPTR